MSFIISDRVRETTDSIGVGTVSLNGAVTGYQSFNNAVGTGNTCYYTIANPGYDEWEVGLGTVGVGILYRTTVLKSSNSNALVSFTTGHKDVFLTYPAQKTVLLDPSNNAPALGTPASINLTNATGLQLTAISTAYTTLLKGNGATVVNAVPGSDYALPTVVDDYSMLKADGIGGFADAVAGTDYALPTTLSDTSILKADGVGGFADAFPGTDYAVPTPYTYSLLSSDGFGGFLSVNIGTGIAYNTGTNTLSSTVSFTYPGAGIAVSTGSAWTTSKASPTGTIVGTTDTQTLTNKRNTPRVVTVTTGTTITPTGDTADIYTVTALASGATIAAPTGTPTNGQQLVLRFLDNGTPQTLTWNAIYRSIGFTLPTTTAATKVLYLGCIYNSQSSTWDVVASAQLS